MKSLSPCIHHNIEVTGKAYLYTPEFNLSISTRGCYEMIREKKQQVGWGIVGNLCLFLSLEVLEYFINRILQNFFQAITVILFRFIQTAHFEYSRFVGTVRPYTIWIFGSYSGKVKKESREPPTPPPVPRELKD